MRSACITGGAGFIGSHLAERLSKSGVEVSVVDDFRTGHRDYLTNVIDHPNFRLFEGDVLDQALLEDAFSGCDWVFHLQANADVRRGLEHPVRDLEQNTVATSRVLEAMRRTGVPNIAFSSTGSVYGEPDVFPTPEDAPFPIQTSLYAASKLACEGLIEAYCAGFGITGVICRFVSILGERYTHGHVIDFYRSLRADPNRIQVLGDGKQEKSYLYVHDCIDAILVAARHHEGDTGSHVYNLGTDETITVDDSLAIITAALGVTPAIEYTGGTRGWTGDSPRIHLDTTRIRSLGWKPGLSIGEAIARTVEWLDANMQVWSDVEFIQDPASTRGVNR
jgi:UDP-glucose 4-epimerase